MSLALILGVICNSDGTFVTSNLRIGKATATANMPMESLSKCGRHSRQDGTHAINFNGICESRNADIR